LPYHKAGSLRILAVNAEKRSAQVPDVPTFREAGLDVPPRGSWYGLFVPRGTPPEVIAKVEKLMTSLARDPAASELMRSLGAEPVFGSSEEFAAGVRDESAFLDTLVKQYSLN
jgi:tripartite-type tricarboxylate transporter receptor subunit TctC